MKYSYIIIFAVCSAASFTSNLAPEAFELPEEESGGSGGSPRGGRPDTPKGITNAEKASSTETSGPQKKVTPISRSESKRLIAANSRGVAIDTTAKAVPSKPSAGSDGTFSVVNPMRKPKSAPDQTTSKEATTPSADSGFSSESSSGFFDVSEITKPQTGSYGILADKKAASASGKSTEKPLFTNVNPSTKRAFQSEVTATVEQISQQLNNMPLKKSGPLCLEILGINSAEITETTPKDLIDAVRSLQISLQHAQKYEDLSSPEALAKIDIGAIVKPADLATINDTLAKLSLPQITPEFSDKGRWIGAPGSAKIKTITFQASRILTEIHEKGQAYLQELQKSKPTSEAPQKALIRNPKGEVKASLAGFIPS